jgi:hypothetical protein
MANNILGIANNLPLQPKVNNLFTLDITTTTIPSLNISQLKIDLMSASRPDIGFNEISMNRLNQKYKVAGTPNPGSTIDVKFRDTIQGNCSKIIWDWTNLIYNPKTGAMGYSVSYKTDAKIIMLDPLGRQIEIWMFKGFWPSKVTSTALEYADSANALDVSTTFSFDLFWIVHETPLAPNATDAYKQSYDASNPINSVQTKVTDGISQVEIPK